MGEILYIDSQHILLFSYTVASSYKCYTDSNISPGNYAYLSMCSNFMIHYALFNVSLAHYYVVTIEAIW
jgi:hypothetical protein